MESSRKRKNLEAEASLSKILLLMNDYSPLIPDETTAFELQKGGFQCDDLRINRLLALASQKFLSDVAGGAMQLAKTRMQQKGRAVPKDKKIVLTMEDLSLALDEHGVSVVKPEYYP